MFRQIRHFCVIDFMPNIRIPRRRRQMAAVSQKEQTDPFRLQVQQHYEQKYVLLLYPDF